MPTPTLFFTLVIAIGLLQFAACFNSADVPEDTKNRTRVTLPIPISSSARSQDDDDSDEETAGLFAFQTTDFDPEKIKRVVIQLHGQGRDAWLYFDQTTEALYNATRTNTASTSKSKKRTKLKRYETLIFAPWFLNEDDEGAYTDLDAGSSTAGPLVWPGSEWANGGDSILPSGASDNVSSFEAIDGAIRHFADRDTFPKMETIIVAGHSMGAQMAQRYALLGAVPSGRLPVHFVVANPGSFAYLTPSRPNSVENCSETYDQWKYGLGVYEQRYLSDFVRESLDQQNDVTDVRKRYSEQRLVHYLFGTADHGKGDTRCEAVTQGLTHLERGRNYMRHLADVVNDESIAAVTANIHTVDYIKNVSHDGLGMFMSKAGIERLFYTNVLGEEEPQGVG